MIFFLISLSISFHSSIFDFSLFVKDKERSKFQRHLLNSFNLFNCSYQHKREKTKYLEDNGLYINFIKKQRTSRSDKMTLSLCSLPVDMVYQILDHLDNKALFLSVRNVCQRLNIIVDSYHRYKVKFKFIIFFDLKKNFRVFSSPCVKTRLNNYKYALTHVITSEYDTL